MENVEQRVKKIVAEQLGVNEAEIKKVVDHIKAQGRPEYDTTITKTEEEMDDSGDLPGRRSARS